ncbi:MAG: hypothetical protein OXH75_15855 [Acidobacteria bacterium]|nr:hypothetical protein [Acidobacteriota bacterium]
MGVEGNEPVMSGFLQAKTTQAVLTVPARRSYPGFERLHAGLWRLPAKDVE